MKQLAILWLACGLVTHLSAQEPTPTPIPTLPPGPLLNRAPDFARWTITSNDAADAPETEATEAEPSATPRRRQRTGEAGSKKSAALTESSDAKAKRVTASATPMTVVTKTPGIRYEETSQGAGAKIQRWCVPDMQATINGEAAPVVSTPGNTADSAYVDYSNTDFPGFEWIAEGNFTGIKAVMGQECWVFEGRPASKKKGDSSSAKTIASINSATRLPVALQTEDQILTYRFELAPTAMVVLPPEVAAVIERWRATMEQSALMPAKP